jgi:hypothetical protein
MLWICIQKCRPNIGYLEDFHFLLNFRRERSYRLLDLAIKFSLDKFSISFSSVIRPFSTISSEKLIESRKIKEDGKKETKKMNEINVSVMSDG